jgi:hypothetical protein
MNSPVPPARYEAEKTYHEQLPELVKTNRLQWVAYSGSQRLGFHTSKQALYQECLDRGFASGQFSIYFIDGSVPTPDDLVV